MKKLLTICLMGIFMAVGSAFGQSAVKAFDDLMKHLDKNPDDILSCVERRDPETKKLESVKSVYVLNNDADVERVKSFMQKIRKESTKYTIERGAVVAKLETKDCNMSVALVSDMSNMRAMEASFYLGQSKPKGIEPKGIVVIKVDYEN